MDSDGLMAEVLTMTFGEPGSDRVLLMRRFLVAIGAVLRLWKEAPLSERSSECCWTSECCWERSSCCWVRWYTGESGEGWKRVRIADEFEFLSNCAILVKAGYGDRKERKTPWSKF